MIHLELDEDEFLVVSGGIDGPAPRTWKRCLEDLGHLESDSDAEQYDEILESYGIERGDLGFEVPIERLCELFTEESPAGEVYNLLSKFEGNSRTKEVLEFYECPSIGSSFHGVKLVGTRMEFRQLLKALGLGNDAHLPVEAEELAEKVATQYAREALRAIAPEEHDQKIDFINALPLVEEYIKAGEPYLDKHSGRKFSSAVAEIPKGSEVYRAIADELQ